MSERCACGGKGCERCLSYDRYQFESPGNAWRLSLDGKRQTRPICNDRYGREMESDIPLND